MEPKKALTFIADGRAVVQTEVHLIQREAPLRPRKEAGQAAAHGGTDTNKIEKEKGGKKSEVYEVPKDVVVEPVAKYG
ncbi:hypothetical protein E2P81_ATG01777 [Venturia nashicola]|nr:hypothetical protein E2P81_ATG01777 [Venturia nashicola]